MGILEPDVTLTDLALAVECAIFALWIWRRSPSSAGMRPWFVAFFAALGTSALLGGLTHGFLADERSPAYQAAWTATLLAIGAAAPAAWALGARLLYRGPAIDRITWFAAALFLVYALAVVFVDREFRVAVWHYLPAALFLLVAFVVAYRRQPAAHLRAGIAGMTLTFVAAGVQRGGIGLHPDYFNHNALYHLVQAIALYLVFRAARGPT